MRLRALTDAPHAFGSSLAAWQDADERRWRSRLVAVPCNVIAVVGDSLIGQVSGTAADSEGRVELISLWVAPAARGQGVGDGLLACVVRWGEACDAVAVVLSVKGSNKRAITLYARMGFTSTDERADEGEVRMRMSLR